MGQTPELSVSKIFGCDIPRNFILQAQSMYRIIAIEETPNSYNGLKDKIFACHKRS